MRRKAVLAGVMVTALGLTLAGCSSGGGSTQTLASGDTAVSNPSASSSDDVGMNEDGTVNNPENVKTDPNKLVFWTLFSGGDGAWMDKIIAAYNATNPPKQVQSVELVWADYYTKLTTAVAAGKGPDIGVSHVSMLPQLVDQGVIQPIDDQATVAGTDWSNFTDSMNAAVTFDGQHYAMPLDTHAEIFYTNTDFMKQAGIPTAANGQVTINSADDLINMLKKIKAAVPADVSPLALPNQGDDPYRVWWATYFQMGGTPIVSDDGTSVTLDKDTAVKAADFVNSLYTDGYILPGITDHQAQFQSGKAATVIAGTWATGAFEQTDGLNFAPQIFPTLFNNSKDAWADGHTLTIPVKKNRSDADTQAAVDFINWVSTTGALTWAGSGQIPSNTTVTTSQDYLNMPYRPDYMQEKEDVVLPPSNPNFASLKQTMIDNLNTIWTGQSSSSDAISNMYDEMGSDLQ